MSEQEAQEARAKLSPQVVSVIHLHVLTQAVRALLAEHPHREAVYRQLNGMMAQVLCQPAFLGDKACAAVAKDFCGFLQLAAPDITPSNPPVKSRPSEVEFSKKEVLREEVEIYRQPDHGCSEPS